MDLPTRGLKMWATWGAVVLLLLLILPIVATYYFVKEVDRYQLCQSDVAQNEDCEPGPLWSFIRELEDSSSGDVSGAIDPTGSDAEMANQALNLFAKDEGKPCGSDFGYCGSGLICVTDTEEVEIGICRKTTESSPLILSLKLEGMALDQGVYVGTAGEDVRIAVQAVNGDRAEMIIGGQTLSLSRGDGGQFTGVYTLPKNLQGHALLFVEKGLETASVSVPVVSVE
ncbi:MAG: hypothetical protein NUV81_02560 [bacterium]|nr:hypothetical protein [bacterium]